MSAAADHSPFLPAHPDEHPILIHRIGFMIAGAPVVEVHMKPTLVMVVITHTEEIHAIRIGPRIGDRARDRLGVRRHILILVPVGIPGMRMEIAVINIVGALSENESGNSPRPREREKNREAVLHELLNCTYDK